MPPVWKSFVQYWCLSQCQARRFWLSLVHTKAPEAVSLRQTLCLFDDFATPLRTIENIARFFNGVATPQRVIHALEILQQERQLSRKESNALMAKVLERVDAAIPAEGLSVNDFLAV